MFAVCSAAVAVAASAAIAVAAVAVVVVNYFAYFFSTLTFFKGFSRRLVVVVV